jgi:hypothetical protein
MSPPDSYTSSPKLNRTSLARSGTVTDRISEKLRAASISRPGPTTPKHKTLASIDEKTLSPALANSTLQTLGVKSMATDPTSPTSPTGPSREDAFVPPTEAGGKPSLSNSTPPPVPSKGEGAVAETQPATVLLSGLSLPGNALRDLLHRFETHVFTTVAPYSTFSPQQNMNRTTAASASRQKNTILGTYERTFSGEELVEWLSQNVEGFGSDWERCADAADELYKMGHLSRVGVGRGFDPSSETFFVLKTNENTPHMPNMPTIPNMNMPNMPSISNLSTSASANIPSLLKSYLPAGLGSDEPVHIRLRRDAVKADEAYKDGVRNVEERRLEMEEKIERGLRVWERWERERLGVIKTGMLGCHSR